MPLSRLAAVVAAGLVVGSAAQAVAAPPAEDRVLSECTFNLADLQYALHDVDLSKLDGGAVNASTIVIYVRQNPNGGQQLKNAGGYTGPVVCVNEDSDAIVSTTESTAIPTVGSVDVTGAEQLFWLQYIDNVSNETDNRFCLSVHDRTDCFLVQPQPTP